MTLASRRARSGGLSSRCSPPRIPAWSGRRPTSGPARPAGRRAGSGTRRRNCWPASELRRDCSPSWTRSCGLRPRSRSPWIRRARSGFSARPPRCCPAPGSGCCCRTGHAKRGWGSSSPPSPGAARRGPSPSPGSAWVISSTSATTWRSAMRRWIPTSSRNSPGSRSRWSASAVSGSNSMTGTCRRRCGSWNAGPRERCRLATRCWPGCAARTTCRSWRWKQTAGSPTCSPARPTGGSRRSPLRRGSPARCGPTRNEAWPGWHFSAGSASA